MAKPRVKARVPIQQRGIESRGKIIDAAMELFAERGYHKTNALEIAEHAGVATGTFYSYFNNKKEVLVEGIKRFYQEVAGNVLTEQLAELQSNGGDPSSDGRAIVRMMIRTLYSAHSHNPRLHREVDAMALQDEEIGELIAAEQNKVVAFMTALMRNNAERLRPKDLEAAAFLVYRAAEEIIHRVRIIGTEIDGERLLAELEDMICRYLILPE